MSLYCNGMMRRYENINRTRKARKGMENGVNTAEITFAVLIKVLSAIICSSQPNFIYDLTIYNLRLESDVYQNQDSSAAESSDNMGSTVPPTESTPRESAFKAPPSPTISVSTAPVGTFSPMES